MPVYRITAPELIAILGDYGLSQTQIARRIGKSVTTINRVANGAQKPQAKTVDALINLVREKSEVIAGMRADLIAMLDRSEITL